MSITGYSFIEAAILASSLSLDAFAAGFSYGSSKIKMPMLSAQIVNVICSSLTGLTLLAGSVISQYIPRKLAVAIAFAILFIIGSVKLLDSITKSIIRKHSGLYKHFKISLFNIKFILHLYANPEDADVDASKTITPSEAAALAVSLSLDGMAIGFGAAFMQVNGLAVFLLSLVTNGAAIILGHILGDKIADKLPFNISWISGVVLIAIAFSKLI